MCTFFIDQTGMTRRLPQPEEGFENVHSRLLDPYLFDPAQQRLAVVRAQFIVKGALDLIQFAIDGLFRFRRQLLSNLLLRAP